MESEQCPRCGDSMTPPQQALSRFDNKTYICPECGRLEAIFAMTEQPMLPLDVNLKEI